MRRRLTTVPHGQPRLTNRDGDVDSIRRREKQTVLRNAALIAVSGFVLWSCAPMGVLERDTGAAAGSRPVDVENPDGAGGAVAGEAKERTCAAAQHRTIVGRPFDEIDTAGLPKPLRVYNAGSRITMDHRPERMNIVVGTEGRVINVKCG